MLLEFRLESPASVLLPAGWNSLDLSDLYFSLERRSLICIIEDEVVVLVYQESK